MIVKNSLLLLTFSLGAHFLNYLYHLVAAKFLPPADFGLLQSFVALNYFLAVLISSFSLSIIRLVNKSKQTLEQILGKLNYLSVKLTFIFWLIFLVSYPAVRKLLHLRNPFIFFLFSLQLLFVFLPTVYSAVFLAKLKFFNFSLLNILTPLFKLIFTVLFLLVGFRVLGVVAALVLTAALGTFLGLVWLKRHFKLKFRFISGRLPLSFYRFFGVTLLTQLSLTSLYSSDILLTRYYFPQKAGLYATASLLGRVIFFLSASVLTVSFPVFAKGRRPKRKDFLQGFLLILLIGLGAVGVYAISPGFFIRVFSTQRYLAAADLLLPFSLFVLIFSLFNLVIKFLLNVKIKVAAAIASLSAVGQILLIIFNHSSLLLIIDNSVLAVSLGLFWGLIFLFKKT